MRFTFSFLSVLLALAAAQDLYDRFDVRELEDAIEDYLIARDGLLEENELSMRTPLPPAGRCGISPEGEFGCIPRTGGRKCGECQPGSIGASCLCSPEHAPPAPVQPHTPDSHGGGSHDNSPQGSHDGGSDHQMSPDSPHTPTDSSIVTVPGAMCFTYSRGGIKDKMCQYKHPSTNRWRNCQDRDICANSPEFTKCTCRVAKSELEDTKSKKQSPDGGSAKQKQKVSPQAPVHH